MKLMTQSITMQEALNLFDFTQGFVKGVVDIKQGLFILEAKNHSDIQEVFVSDHQSDMKDLWGLRLHKDGHIEYNSLINIPQNYALGYEEKATSILDENIQAIVTGLVKKYIKDAFL